MSWFHQHVLGHHIYTNIMEADPDLPLLRKGDMRYLVKRQFWSSIYQYQHIYMPILYGLLSCKVRLQDFTWTFFGRTNGAIPVNPLSNVEWAHFFITKFWFLFYRVLAPVFIFGMPLSTLVLYFFITEITTGYWLAFNFQVSHISSEAFFPCNTEFEKELQSEWAVSQIVTSVDYGHGDFWTALFSGALNYQSVHHLFPGVSQYHYPAIAPIVKQVCKEYNVPFNVLPGFREAVSTHLGYLYKMGNQVS